MSLCNRQTAVAREDHFTLLGDLEGRRSRRCWPSQDRPIHRPAAPPDRAAPAVKHDQLHTCGRCRRRQVLLRAIGRPRGRQVAAILVAVRITDHDLLAMTAGPNGCSIGRALEHPREDVTAVAQLRNRLEERYDVQAAARAIDQTRFTGQEQHRQGVARGARHRHHASLGATRSAQALDVVHRLERLEDFTRLGRQRFPRHSQRLVRQQPFLEHLHALRLGHVEVARCARHAEQLGHRGRVSPSVLTHLELGQRKAEGFDAPLQVQQPAVGDTAATARLEAHSDEPQICQQLVGRAVAAWSARIGASQAFGDEPQLATVGLIVPLGDALHAQLPAIQLDRLQELWEAADEATRDAQIAAQELHVIAVAAEHCRASQAGGSPGYVGRHGGIAVAVAADPGAKAESWPLVLVRLAIRDRAP